MEKVDYTLWDKMYEERKKFKDENPNYKLNSRPKTFVDENSETRCTKCGSTERIGNCTDCQNEKEHLKTKETHQN